MSNDEAFFKWSSAYSVGIPTIDDQHLELVNILNRLFVAVSKREGGKVIAEILDALMDYTRTHFALEERLLLQAKYKDFDAHKEEHRKLIEQLDLLCKKHLIEDKQIHFEMLNFLRTWLKEHIQGVDTKYSEVLKLAGFSTLAWEKQAQLEFSGLSSKKKQWWQLW